MVVRAEQRRLCSAIAHSFVLSVRGRVRECGEQLTKLHPEMADGYMFLGASAHNAGRLDESLAMFEQAVAREPERSVAQKLRSLAR
jgi:lipoprotein NlpI